MGRIIFLTLVVVFFFVLAFWSAYRTGREMQARQAVRMGYLNKKGAVLLERADGILKELGVTSTLDEVEILTPQHKEAVTGWRSDYNKWRG